MTKKSFCAFTKSSHSSSLQELKSTRATWYFWPYKVSSDVFTGWIQNRKMTLKLRSYSKWINSEVTSIYNGQYTWSETGRYKYDVFTFYENPLCTVYILLELWVITSTRNPKDPGPTPLLAQLDERLGTAKQTCPET